MIGMMGTVAFSFLFLFLLPILIDRFPRTQREKRNRGKMQITRQGDILTDVWLQTVWRHPKSVELQGI